MARAVGIGIQSFEKLIRNHCFYIDKTHLIKEWWENQDEVTLITRPRRFGKTLNMDMLEHFFSIRYMEDLLKGGSLSTKIDEQIIFDQLDQDEDAIWSLFLASGYLKVDSYAIDEDGEESYTLSLTNKEVRIMFRRMIKKWSSRSRQEYNGFIRAMLKGDCKEMNAYMTRFALNTFSYFDTGNRPSGAEPERFHSVEATTKRFKEQNASVCFYHGFVLGLMVDLADRYVITSNRESGFGRYDVMLEPRQAEDPGIVMEFKVRDPQDEKTLADTAIEALAQIKQQRYTSTLEAKGIGPERIFQYGLAFEGKNVQIQKA